MEFWRIESQASFAMSREGLLQAPEMGAVLVDRANALSRNPRREDVLVLAHGPESDEENERWLERMEAHADRVRESAPFRRVAVETLREDWPQERARVERRIRELVATAGDEGRDVIVIPFRVHGFGPYADVLDGLDYTADGRGLLPHAEVTKWIDRQAAALAAELGARADHAGTIETIH